MRIAQPDELTTRVYPLFTARLTSQELSKWFPFPFEEISDPEAVREPSKFALLKLERGPHFVAFWGEESEQLEISISKATDPAGFLQAFFHESALPEQRILWRRADADIEASRNRQKTA
jgi:hypothetical protein